MREWLDSLTTYQIVMAYLWSVIITFHFLTDPLDSLIGLAIVLPIAAALLIYRRRSRP